MNGGEVSGRVIQGEPLCERRGGGREVCGLHRSPPTRTEHVGFLPRAHGQSGICFPTERHRSGEDEELGSLRPATEDVPDNALFSSSPWL